MERARVLRWRLEQQTLRMRELESDAQSRAAARVLRPLLADQLPGLAQQLTGSAAIIQLAALPTSRVVCDRECVLVEEPIRDYLTTKAFRLPALAGVFVMTIEPSAMSCALFVTRYRPKSQFIDDTWLPPGDYVEAVSLATQRWPSGPPPSHIVPAILHDIALSQDRIRAACVRARRDARRRFWYRSLRQGVWSALYGAYVLLFVGLFLWLLNAILSMP